MLPILLAEFASPGPLIFQIGPLSVRWYGLLIAIAVLVGVSLSSRLARARAIDPLLISEDGLLRFKDAGLDMVATDPNPLDAVWPDRPAPPMAPNNTNLANTKGLATGITSVLSASKVNNFRYGITRVGTESTGVSLLPFTTFRTIDSLNGSDRPFIRKTPVHTLSNDFSWNMGKHDFKFGGVIRLIRNNRQNYANSFSSASANASWLNASGADLNAPLTDIRSTARVAYRDAAMAVLGVISQGNARYNYNKDGTPLPAGAPVVRQFNAEEYEFYAQDSWKVSKAMTVTYGLRWSLMPPIYEANGIQTVPKESLASFFDKRVALADVGAPQFLVNPVEYVLSEQPGGRSLYPFHKKNLSPRVGIAYSPQGDSGLSKFFFGGPGKTSIRAGWGMFYDVMGAGLITNADSSALGLSTALSNPSARLTLSTAPRFTSASYVVAWRPP